MLRAGCEWDAMMQEYYPRRDNQLEKQIENEMATGSIYEPLSKLLVSHLISPIVVP